MKKMDWHKLEEMSPEAVLTVAKQLLMRLMEIEEISQSDDGVFYWDSCGDPIVGMTRGDE